MKDYNQNLHNATVVVDAFMQKTFTGIEYHGPTLSPDLLNSCPTMAVCTHRSHVDYILLGIMLHKLGLNNLRFAAGDNLTNMPYVGRKFLSYGAFSVYRTRALNRNYIFELTKQVVGMLLDNENIILFPEGGRSYDGSMMELKNGILAANILAQHRDPEHQYKYLPCAISYEHLPEINWFELLEKGKQLRKLKLGFFGSLRANTYYYGSDLIAFAKFIAAHKFRLRYGRVIIDYDTPVAVNDIVDIAKEYAPNARNEFFAHKTAMQIVGEDIRKRLVKLYRVLPMHVVAAALMRKNGTEANALTGLITEICGALEKNGRNCKSLSPFSSQEILEKGIDQLNNVKALSGEGNNVRIRSKKLITYYAASIDVS